LTNDVKPHVEAMVENGTVSINGFNTNLGGDPFPGYSKFLYVRYQNQSGIYEAVVREGLTFTIPDASHIKLQ
jgi:hypothetical protein